MNNFRFKVDTYSDAEKSRIKIKLNFFYDRIPNTLSVLLDN